MNIESQYVEHKLMDNPNTKRTKFDQILRSFISLCFQSNFTQRGLSGCLSCNGSLVFNSNRARTGRNDCKDSANISNELPGGGTFVVI